MAILGHVFWGQWKGDKGLRKLRNFCLRKSLNPSADQKLRTRPAVRTSLNSQTDSTKYHFSYCIKNCQHYDIFAHHVASFDY